MIYMKNQENNFEKYFVFESFRSLNSKCNYLKKLLHLLFSELNDSKTKCFQNYEYDCIHIFTFVSELK